MCTLMSQKPREETHNAYRFTTQKLNYAKCVILNK